MVQIIGLDSIVCSFPTDSASITLIIICLNLFRQVSFIQILLRFQLDCFGLLQLHFRRFYFEVAFFCLLFDFVGSIMLSIIRLWESLHCSLWIPIPLSPRSSFYNSFHSLACPASFGQEISIMSQMPIVCCFLHSFQH